MDKDNENLQDQNEGSKTIFQITEKYLARNFNIRYNIITNVLQIKKVSEPNYIDLNIDALYVHLQNKKIAIEIKKLNSLLNSGIMENYNPIKNYFEKVSKMKRESSIDYIDQLSDYVRTKNQVRFKHHFK